MDSEALNRIERELSLKLPQDYAAFQLSYPDDLDPDIREHEIFADAERVIAETQLARSNDFMTREWDPSWLVIGDSGCGDWYFIETAKKPAPVKCWNHETDDFEDEEPSLQKWYDAIMANP